jgi:hypothetical protein
MLIFVRAVFNFLTSGIPARYTTPTGQTKAMEQHNIDGYLWLHEKFYIRSIAFTRTVILHGIFAKWL